MYSNLLEAKLLYEAVLCKNSGIAASRWQINYFFTSTEWADKQEKKMLRMKDNPTAASQPEFKLHL